MRLVPVPTAALVGVLSVTAPVAVLMAVIVLPGAMPAPEIDSFTYRFDACPVVNASVVELAAAAAAGVKVCAAGIAELKVTVSPATLPTFVLAGMFTPVMSEPGTRVEPPPGGRFVVVRLAPPTEVPTCATNVFTFPKVEAEDPVTTWESVTVLPLTERIVVPFEMMPATADVTDIPGTSEAMPAWSVTVAELMFVTMWSPFWGPAVRLKFCVLPNATVEPPKLTVCDGTVLTIGVPLIFASATSPVAVLMPEIVVFGRMLAPVTVCPTVSVAACAGESVMVLPAVSAVE